MKSPFRDWIVLAFSPFGLSSLDPPLREGSECYVSDRKRLNASTRMLSTNKKTKYKRHNSPP